MFAGNIEIARNSTTNLPQWVHDFDNFRRTQFLRFVEPVVQLALGPVVEEDDLPRIEPAAALEGHVRRRLSFLPDYVRNIEVYHETSMSFVTLFVLFFVLSSLMLVFLSCFYHNQKTSPLFISPRRHRLPRLVPPALPVDGTFSWVQIILFMSDEEIINRVGYDALVMENVYIYIYLSTFTSVLMNFFV